MTLKEVSTRQDREAFLGLPVRINRGNPHWIRPLNKDIEAVFDKNMNKAFRHGECTRWLLLDDDKKVLGRVAAFINEKTVHKGNDQPTGGMGFFECIDNRDAAFQLFDQCRSWLESRGMEAMDGPVNFGSRDRWWGLLVNGFDRDPNYQCNYNPPYYQELFEAYGFKLYFKQFTFYRTVAGPLAPRLHEKAERVARDPRYTIRHLKKNELDKLAHDLQVVYNKAWANRFEMAQMTDAQARLIVKQMKPIIDEKLLWFAYYDEEPVAFFISLPEVNQIFRFVNGKLDWLGKLKFLWHTVRKTNRKAFGILFGIVPAHQGKGVDGAMVLGLRRVLQDEYHRYDEYEMNWIGDFNPKMIQVVEQVGGAVSKVHHTYRKLFDESKPFRRAPILH
jgi:hypothetical protein